MTTGINFSDVFTISLKTIAIKLSQTCTMSRPLVCTILVLQLLVFSVISVSGVVLGCLCACKA